VLEDHFVPSHGQVAVDGSIAGFPKDCGYVIAHVDVDGEWVMEACRDCYLYPSVQLGGHCVLVGLREDLILELHGCEGSC
jgi:hypothetical protein